MCLKSQAPPSNVHFFSSFHFQSPLQLNAGSPLSPSNHNVPTEHNACNDLHTHNLVMKYKQCTAKNLQTAAKYAHPGNMRDLSQGLSQMNPKKEVWAHYIWRSVGDF